LENRPGGGWGPDVLSVGRSFHGGTGGGGGGHRRGFSNPRRGGPGGAHQTFGSHEWVGIPIGKHEMVSLGLVMEQGGDKCMTGKGAARLPGAGGLWGASTEGGTEPNVISLIGTPPGAAGPARGLPGPDPTNSVARQNTKRPGGPAHSPPGPQRPPDFSDNRGGGCPSYRGGGGRPSGGGAGTVVKKGSASSASVL